MDHSKISQVANAAVAALGSAKEFTVDHVGAHAAFLGRGEHPSVATMHAEMEPGASFAQLSAQDQLALKVFHAVVTVLAREPDFATEPEPVVEDKQPEPEAEAPPAAEAAPVEEAPVI